MTQLREPKSFETAFGVYVVNEIIGEGGSGRVYGGVGLDHNPIALKVLAKDKATADKRKRFKNEVAFLLKNAHRNIVTVLDQGASPDGPFYVMPRYAGNLRSLMDAGLAPEQIMPLFSQILDGVEAAHLQGVIHRDLKPENVLFRKEPDMLMAVADFGISRFNEDALKTLVETQPQQRMANFAYAAPEQYSNGQVTIRTDICALGMLLNEMFTRSVPHGTEYKKIAGISPEHGYLDGIVERMLRHDPGERPQTIADLKGLIQRYHSEAVALQRLSEIKQTVVREDDIDEPLALEPPRLVDFDYENGMLILKLDRPVNGAWVDALNMSPVGGLLAKGPEYFKFRGKEAMVTANENQVQHIINFFKGWLPQATNTLRQQLVEENARKKRIREDELHQERMAEEQRIRVLKNVTI